jgi:DNA replication and repair protein RecF
VPLERVRVRSVRCLLPTNVTLHPERNYVFGPNGAGKTSFLEALYLLGRGRSFRTRQTARLVQIGTQELAVAGSARDATGRKNLAVTFRAGHLDVQIDGVNGSLIELAHVLPMHVIDPQLHELIEGGPSVRRRYLDAGVFHVEPGYLSVWRDYRRALAQRNAALHRGGSGAGLAVWTEALAQAGLPVHAQREAYVAGLSALVRQIGSRLLGRAINIEYRPGWPQGQELAAAIRASALRDRGTGYSQVGPHRADLAVRLGEGGVRDAVSRGQQKLVAATLVLAQVAMFAGRAGHGGTLLVDDPSSELDAGAVERLLAELLAVDAQLVITGLSAAALPPQAGYPVFHVEQGEIKPVL